MGIEWAANHNRRKQSISKARKDKDQDHDQTSDINKGWDGV